MGESEAFARLCGDFNPLHVDAVTARRTQFGGTVIHGIHLLLRSLDELAARQALEYQEPAALSATFHNPVLTGTVVKLMVTAVGATRIRVSAQSAGRPAFTSTVELKPAYADAMIEDLEFAPTRPAEMDYPPTVSTGAVPLQLGRELLNRLFPSLAALVSRSWIADLLATTQVVGMRCPGMDSIYSGLKLRRLAQNDGSASELRYQIAGSEGRLRLVRMQVNGSYFAGTIEAFFRPRPVMQRTMREVAALVPSPICSGHRVLIVGGSRGLGEVAAKIAAAGGADVTITYARGQQDAERVCAEIKESGRHCETRRLDAMDLESERTWLRSCNFSHVYFFASPPIAANTDRWNEDLFQQFRSVYVTAFATLVELTTARRRHDAPVHYLYPSSIFVEQPENGFAEYIAAKTEGEALCDRLARQANARFTKPRLPRLRTDQTSALVDAGAGDPLPPLLAIVRQFHQSATPVGV